MQNRRKFVRHRTAIALMLIVAVKDHLTVSDLAIGAYEQAHDPKRLVLLPGGHFDAYVAGYFVHPDPAVYQPLADVLARVTLSPDYPKWARAAALAFQMIYQQPVRYEYRVGAAWRSSTTKG